MQGLAGDAGDPAAKDPVDRVSSRVQAVGCFYPPTDFLNYGKEGERAGEECSSIHYLAFLIHAPTRPNSTPATTTTSANPTRASPNRSRSVM